MAHFYWLNLFTNWSWRSTGNTMINSIIIIIPKVTKVTMTHTNRTEYQQMFSNSNCLTLTVFWTKQFGLNYFWITYVYALLKFSFKLNQEGTIEKNSYERWCTYESVDDMSLSINSLYLKKRWKNQSTRLTHFVA